MPTRKIIFLTGTRADFGKLKSLMLRLQADEHFEVHVFVTGMHMLSKYGSTWEEVRKAGLTNLYRFINQNENDSMDHILAKTIAGLSDYVREVVPDMLVVHGDRLEPLAGAIVGAFNNIRVAHIEGGEVSGTIDEVIRHSISKMSHLHFVANVQAKKRLLQLGEADETIHVIGSPDVDLMNSLDLPSLD
ncbi:MAG: UDP-N-acetylglucosamine 2-epimerase (hydrolyzing), partial [Actinobacteria bacterium]|nr:UDP-N-acetylglucosamine 2-epimerase (hydrolyzing) [Actinomycetota bacterium]